MTERMTEKEYKAQAIKERIVQIMPVTWDWYALYSNDGVIDIAEKVHLLALTADGELKYLIAENEQPFFDDPSDCNNFVRFSDTMPVLPMSLKETE